MTEFQKHHNFTIQSKVSYRVRILKALLVVLLWLVPVSLVLAHGISEADKKAMLAGGNLRYIWLGATHMLTGYDHLLFIFGVIFFLTSFRDIVKYITAFTIGHSITLLFATLLHITANYYLVDAVIALSVMYKGFENLDGFQKYLDMKSPNQLWVIFGFGLIHGFGLSTRLQQLPLGDHGMVWRILSFNLGVELGQIAALTVMLLFITAWRRTDSFQRFSTASNFGLVMAGGFLFLMQMHGYAHTKYPHEFAPHRDAHHHDHTNMKHKKTQGHSHSHNHGKGHSHSHDQGKGHSHDHGKGHSHSHGNDNKGHSHKHDHKHGHGHDHGKGHSHDHGSPAKRRPSARKTKATKTPAKKPANRKKKSKHSHDHGHGHSHDHDHGHNHDHKHDHGHSHDHE